MTGLKLVAVLVLVAANAFFVAVEFALVGVRRSRVEELVALGSRRAASTLKAIDQLTLQLSSCQLGITLASLGLGAIGEPALAHVFDGLFGALPSPLDVIATHGSAVAMAFVIITILHVVLGEQVPKNLSIAAPETTSLWLAPAIRGFTFAFRPFVWLFNESANGILKLLGVQSKSELSNLHSPDEIAILIRESWRGGAIKAGQSDILTRTLEFPEKKVVDAMVPRIGAQSVSGEAPVERLLDLAEATGYSRFPVWTQRQDEFVGVVHLKDMLRTSRKSADALVKDAMREALLVHETLPLEQVLLQMRRKRNHFAIVLDEFGSTAGIITLEDIIEELLGEIRDEYDVHERDVKAIEGGLRVPGTMRPDELRDATGCKLPEGDYETVAGFILDNLGRLARRGDEVMLNGYRIKVVNVRQRRILSVDVAFPPK